MLRWVIVEVLRVEEEEAEEASSVAEAMALDNDSPPAPTVIDVRSVLVTVTSVVQLLDNEQSLADATSGEAAAEDDDEAAAAEAADSSAAYGMTVMVRGPAADELEDE